MNNMEVNLQIHSQLEKLIEWNLEVIVSLNKLFNSTFQGDSHINLETINNGEIKPGFNGIFRYQYFCLTSYLNFRESSPHTDELKLEEIDTTNMTPSGMFSKFLILKLI